MNGLSVQDLAARIENSLGLGALGDWLGSSMEGVPLHERTVDRSEGALTDDTIMTMATAETIASSRAVVPEQIAARFLEAFEDGIPGIGSSTLGAMQALRAGQHWALSGIQGDRAAGNGAAMRIAPVAFVLDPVTDSGRQLILDVARITHRNDEATTGALALAGGVRMALSNEVGLEGLARLATLLPDTRIRDALVDASTLGEVDPKTAAARLGSSGYVVESVPLALYLGFCSQRPPVEAIVAAVLVSEDADTVGSMVGQLLGAAGQVLSEADPVRQRLPGSFAELAQAIADVGYRY